MVQLTRLNHESFLLNSDLIEQVDITPDTVITLTNSHKLLVLESAQEVVRRVREFRRSLICTDLSPVVHSGVVSSDGSAQ